MKEEKGVRRRRRGGEGGEEEKGGGGLCKNNVIFCTVSDEFYHEINFE